MVSASIVKTLITQVRKAKNLTREEFANKIGYNPTYISDAQKKGASEKFIKTIKLKFPEVFNESENQTVNETRDEGVEYKTSTHHDNSAQVIYSLTESHRILAEANKIQSEANRLQNEANLTLALANKDLVNMVTTTAHGDAGIPAALVKIIAKIASGTRWHTEDEALAVLTKELYSTPANAGQ